MLDYSGAQTATIKGMVSEKYAISFGLSLRELMFRFSTDDCYNIFCLVFGWFFKALSRKHLASFLMSMPASTF